MKIQIYISKCKDTLVVDEQSSTPQQIHRATKIAAAPSSSTRL
jgi:hypothetical protein